MLRVHEEGTVFPTQHTTRSLFPEAWLRLTAELLGFEVPDLPPLHGNLVFLYFFRMWCLGWEMCHSLYGTLLRF